MKLGFNILTINSVENNETEDDDIYHVDNDER